MSELECDKDEKNDLVMSVNVNLYPCVEEDKEMLCWKV